jgi:hypothetical protein
VGQQNPLGPAKIAETPSDPAAKPTEAQTEQPDAVKALQPGQPKIEETKSGETKAEEVKKEESTKAKIKPEVASKSDDVKTEVKPEEKQAEPAAMAKPGDKVVDEKKSEVSTESLKQAQAVSKTRAEDPLLFEFPRADLAHGGTQYAHLDCEV